MIPSSRNTWTNDTIAACCCTMPNTAAYARCAAVTGSEPAAMNALPRPIRARAARAASRGRRARRRCWCTSCCLRASSVPVVGDADAAAEVAHQVEEARRVPHALARDRIHADRRQRHEQHRQPEALEELRPEDVPVAGVQVQLAEPEQRAGAHRSGRPRPSCAGRSCRSATRSPACR